jgi:hypothetical protein
VKLPEGLVFDAVLNRVYRAADYCRILGAVATILYTPADGRRLWKARGHAGPWHCHFDRRLRETGTSKVFLEA